MKLQYKVLIVFAIIVLGVVVYANREDLNKMSINLLERESYQLPEIILPSGELDGTRYYYTPNTETNCTGLQCTTKLYDGVVFAGEGQGSGITLQNISDIKWQNGKLNFSAEDWWVLIEPFVIYKGQYRTVQDVRNAFPNINFRNYTTSTRFDSKFSFDLSNVPSNIISNVNNIGLRVVDSNGLTLNDLNLDKENDRLIIKDRFQLSYHDLKENHYTLNLVNHSYLLIGNISENYQNGLISIDPTFTLKQQEYMTDSHMRSNNVNANYGATGIEGIKAYCGNADCSTGYRGLWKYDFAQIIPSDADVTDCNLYLNVTYAGGSPAQIAIYRMLKGWTENQVTWTVNQTGTNWETAGAKGASDVSSTVQDNITISSAGSFVSWDMDSEGYENLCENWINGTYPNHGVLLAVKNNDDYDDFAFQASEATVLAERPFVSITYTSNTCTYSGSGDWVIDCSDNCVISTAYNLGGNNLIISGEGITRFTNTGKPYNFARAKFDGINSAQRCKVRVLA